MGNVWYHLKGKKKEYTKTILHYYYFLLEPRKIKMFTKQ